MNVENCIEAQYRELMECSEPNAEYLIALDFPT